MTSEADEHEQALALEMGYQRRQWIKMQKLEKQMGEQVVRMDELEHRLQDQMERQRGMEKQADLHRRDTQNALAGLVERCDGEREARQKELCGLKASINALEGKFDDMLCEAVQDLNHARQKGQQELRDSVQRQQEHLAQDLGSKCEDLERLFREECAELVRGCTGCCAELGREAAEERDARQKELRGLQTSIKAVEAKLDEMLSEAVRDLTHSHQKDQQELRSSCDAVQRQHEDLVKDLGSRCRDLERLFKEESAELLQGCKGLETKFHDILRKSVQGLTDSQQKGHQELRSSCDTLQRRHQDLAQAFNGRCKDLEELRGSVSSVEHQSRELVRETTKDLSQLMHSKHKELAARMDGIEHDLDAHTHEFTSTQIYKCGMATAPPASSPTAGSEA